MNTKLRTIIATAGIGLAGISVGGVAAAQSYGDSAPEVAETADVAEAATLLEVQDVPEAETDGEIAPESEGEADAREGRRGHGGGCGLDAAAEALGIEADELRDQLDADTSIADVAEANGVDAAIVIDAMVAEAADELADKVEQGRLTQDDADERLAGLEDKITERVTTPGTEGDRGERSNRGDRGTDDDGEATEDTAA